MSVYRHDAREGSGLPPHSHQWDDAYHVIQCVVNSNCGGVERSVAAGGFVHVPAARFIHRLNLGERSLADCQVDSSMSADGRQRDHEAEPGVRPSDAGVFQVGNRIERR
jgi:hypothetical protein